MSAASCGDTEDFHSFTRCELATARFRAGKYLLVSPPVLRLLHRHIHPPMATGVIDQRAIPLHAHSETLLQDGYLLHEFAAGNFLLSRLAGRGVMALRFAYGRHHIHLRSWLPKSAIPTWRRFERSAFADLSCCFPSLFLATPSFKRTGFMSQP